VVVRAAVNTNQEDGQVHPVEAQEIELELVHVGGLRRREERSRRIGVCGPALQP